MARFFLLATRVCQPLLQLSGKKSAPNDNVKIGYYSIFLLSNDRKRSYESIGMVIYWYRSVVKKWLTPLQKSCTVWTKVARFDRPALCFFFIFFIFLFFSQKENSVPWIENPAFPALFFFFSKNKKCSKLDGWTRSGSVEPCQDWIYSHKKVL